MHFGIHIPFQRYGLFNSVQNIKLLIIKVDINLCQSLVYYVLKGNQIATVESSGPCKKLLGPHQFNFLLVTPKCSYLQTIYK